jgi:hypothetical protein
MAKRSLESSPFGNPEIALPEPPDVVHELTVTVTLTHAEPPIWRRIVVAGDTLLDHVHAVLQVAMGWTDCHLHRFYPGVDDGGPHFVTDEDLGEGEEGTNESTVRLDQLLREVGDCLIYDYDFGDGWSHVVRLEKAEPLSTSDLPRCLAGDRACPPEDIGGMGAYDDVLEWFDAGRPAKDAPAAFDNVEDLTAWLPDGFDPAAFDLRDVNLRLRAQADADGLMTSLHPDLALLLGQLDPPGLATAHLALARLPDRTMTDDEIVAATKHYRVLLDAIGDGVQLTGAGYLPPAVVSTIFGELGLADRWIGKGNREDHTPPIHQLRLSATNLGLLRKAKGTLTPTVAAMRVAGDPAGLFAHVVDRLPLGGRDVEHEASWFSLLGIASGRPQSDHGAFAAAMLAARGWEIDGADPVDHQAYRLQRPTMLALVGPTQDLAREWAPWVQLAAAEIVRPRTRA